MFGIFENILEIGQHDSSRRFQTRLDLLEPGQLSQPTHRENLRVHLVQAPRVVEMGMQEVQNVRARHAVRQDLLRSFQHRRQIAFTEYREKYFLLLRFSRVAARSDCCRCL